MLSVNKSVGFDMEKGNMLQYRLIVFKIQFPKNKH